MVSIKYVSLEDKEFWFSLDAHLAETEFDKKVRDKQGMSYMMMEFQKDC